MSVLIVLSCVSLRISSIQDRLVKILSLSVSRTGSVNPSRSLSTAGSRNSAAASKKDIEFKTELDLKMIIAKKNIDTLRLNTDFLMATTHKLFDGIAILGMDYLVIYAMRYCDIVNVKEITHAETFHDVQKISNGTITRCKLRIYMSYNEMITMTMKDDSEMELMANELGIRGIRVEEK